MELTVTNRSRAYPGRSSGDSKVDDVQYVVLKVCYLCTSGSVVEYRLAKARVAGSNPVSCSQRDRKRVIRWMALFSMFEPCRVRTVRMSALCSGRRRRTSPGRSATPRALFYKDIQCGCPFFVKKSFTSGVYYKKLLEKVCTLSKKSLEKVYILSKSRLKKFVISYITSLKK